VRHGSAKLWLCVAPTALSFLDTALTLWGQAPEYWAGDYTRCREGNPVLRWCLEQHPAAALAESAAWVVLFGAAVLVLPWRAAKVLALAVALGHVVGASSWLEDRLGTYWVYPGVLLGCAWMIVWTWERADDRQCDDKRAELSAAAADCGATTRFPEA
jgi:hypothetical protein